MANQPGLWKKRVLVPFWIVRICIMVFIIAIYVWALRHVEGLEDFSKPTIGAVVVFLLLIAACLLIDLLAIVLFLRDALKPGTFLIMNSSQTGFWGGVLIMDLVSIMRGASAAGIGFSIFVFLSFLGLLVYAAVQYHKAKKEAQRGHYAAAHNPVVPAPAAYAPPYQSASPYHQDTAYYPPTNPSADANSQYLPPYQAQGASTDLYTTQPTKPAQIV